MELLLWTLNMHTEKRKIKGNEIYKKLYSLDILSIMALMWFL